MYCSSHCILHSIDPMHSGRKARSGLPGRCGAIALLRLILCIQGVLGSYLTVMAQFYPGMCHHCILLDTITLTMGGSRMVAWKQVNPPCQLVSAIHWLPELVRWQRGWIRNGSCSACEIQIPHPRPNNASLDLTDLCQQLAAGDLSRPFGDQGGGKSTFSLHVSPGLPWPLPCSASCITVGQPLIGLG